MGAISDIWKSERGLIGILLIIGATVLAILGKMPVDHWETYSQVIFGIYATTKTVTGAVDMLTSKKSDPVAAAGTSITPAAPPAPAPTPATTAGPVTAAAVEPPK